LSIALLYFKLHSRQLHNDSDHVAFLPGQLPMQGGLRMLLFEKLVKDKYKNDTYETRRRIVSPEFTDHFPRVIGLYDRNGYRFKSSHIQYLLPHID